MAFIAAGVAAVGAAQLLGAALQAGDDDNGRAIDDLALQSAVSQHTDSEIRRALLASTSGSPSRARYQHLQGRWHVGRWPERPLAQRRRNAMRRLRQALRSLFATSPSLSDSTDSTTEHSSEGAMDATVERWRQRTESTKQLMLMHAESLSPVSSAPSSDRCESPGAAMSMDIDTPLKGAAVINHHAMSSGTWPATPDLPFQAPRRLNPSPVDAPSSQERTGFSDEGTPAHANNVALGLPPDSCAIALNFDMREGACEHSDTVDHVEPYTESSSALIMQSLPGNAEEVQGDICDAHASTSDGQECVRWAGHDLWGAQTFSGRSSLSSDVPDCDHGCTECRAGVVPSCSTSMDEHGSHALPLGSSPDMCRFAVPKTMSTGTQTLITDAMPPPPSTVCATRNSPVPGTGANITVASQNTAMSIAASSHYASDAADNELAEFLMLEEMSRSAVSETPMLSISGAEPAKDSAFDPELAEFLELEAICIRDAENLAEQPINIIYLGNNITDEASPGGSGVKSLFDVGKFSEEVTRLSNGNDPYVCWSEVMAVKDSHPASSTSSCASSSDLQIEISPRSCSSPALEAHHVIQGLSGPPLGVPSERSGLLKPQVVPSLCLPVSVPSWSSLDTPRSPQSQRQLLNFVAIELLSTRRELEEFSRPDKASPSSGPISTETQESPNIASVLASELAVLHDELSVIMNEGAPLLSQRSKKGDSGFLSSEDSTPREDGDMFVQELDPSPRLCRRVHSAVDFKTFASPRAGLQERMSLSQHVARLQTGISQLQTELAAGLELGDARQMIILTRELGVLRATINAAFEATRMRQNEPLPRMSPNAPLKLAVSAPGAQQLQPSNQTEASSPSPLPSPRYHNRRSRLRARRKTAGARFTRQSVPGEIVSSASVNLAERQSMPKLVFSTSRLASGSDLTVRAVNATRGTTTGSILHEDGSQTARMSVKEVQPCMRRNMSTPSGLVYSTAAT